MDQQERMVHLNEKVNQINKLCSLLKIEISAIQSVGKDGIIRNVLYYKDNEVYPEPIKEETTKPAEDAIPKKNVQPANI